MSAVPFGINEDGGGDIQDVLPSQALHSAIEIKAGALRKLVAAP